MGYVSTKSERKRLLIALLIVGISILCLGCDPYYDDYPYCTESEWICSNPVFTLSYTFDSNGGLKHEEFLGLNGETIAVDVLFHAGSYFAMPENSNLHSERLFSGRWKYRDGDLVLTIKEDFIFHNQYEELVFSLVTKN